MPDYASINGVAAADIASINGVSKAGIATVSGAATPASGASRWVVASAGGYILHAANSDLTSWSSYDCATDSPNSIALASGKNSAGQIIYVAGTDAASRELLVSGTDITAAHTFTDVNISPNDDQYAVSWGAKSDGATAGVWMSAGDDGLVMRSTDGAATWSAVNMSSTNLGTKVIWGIANNGAGKWAFAAGSAYLYVSTDDGASFSESEPWGTDTPGKIKGIIYTKNAGGGGSWVIAYSRSSTVHFRSCSDSDLTDWSAEFSVNSTNFPARASNGTGASVTFANPSSQEEFIRMAAYNGKIVACSTADEVLISFDVDGKTISNGTFRDGNKSDETGLDLDSGDLCASLATDGTTWVLSCRGGDIHTSTDGDTWTRVLNDESLGGSQRHLNAVACDVLLPL